MPKWSRVLALVGLVGLVAADSMGQVAPQDDAIDAWQFGEVPIGRLLAEDAAAGSRLRPVRFAEGRDQLISPADSGTLAHLPDGTVRWRLRLESTNGLSVNFGSMCELPPSAVMSLRDGAGQAIFRPITAADNQPHGQLWSPVVAGAAMEIDVTMAAEDWGAFEAGFWITDVNLGYRSLSGAMAEAMERRGGGDRGIEAQDSCLIDVACPEADPWRAQVNGVAAYTINGILTCSGSMLNNTAEDGTPYFYTANHCGTQNNPGGVVTYWNMQSSYCRPVYSVENGEIGDGEYDQPILGGAVLIANAPDGDSTLIELLGTPDPAYAITYCGWDWSAADVSSAVGISHPGVQEKRIALDVDPALWGIFDGSPFGLSPTIEVWQATWEQGGINRGSSGSPMFDQDGRVVGTATAAGPLDIPNYCPQQVTIYGRLSKAFADDPAFAAALDPLGTGQVTMDYRGFHAPSPCVGDVNGDGMTDVFDFGDLASNFGAVGLAPFVGGDLDGNGTVDVFDFGVLASDFGCGGS